MPRRSIAASSAAPSSSTTSSSARFPRKSTSHQALRTKTSTARLSAATEIPDEGPATRLRAQTCSIFASAQRDTTTQRKLVVSLRKVQERCCYESSSTTTTTPSVLATGGKKPKKGAGAGAGENKKLQNGGGGAGGAGREERDEQEEFGEEDFNEEVGRCVLRVLTVKKSEPVGDRIVKFLGLFLSYASEKDNTLAKAAEADAGTDATDIYAETPSSRLTSHILSLLLPLLSAKDKTVRFRAAQITSHVINTLESIDDELFQKMRIGLLRRIHDRETAVRVQAVLGLGRLAGEGDEEDGDEEDDDQINGEGRDIDDSFADDSTIAGIGGGRGGGGGRGAAGAGVLEKLVEALQHDPAAEVRRSLLLNLPLVPATLPLLLERARDVDAGARRGLYAKLLPNLGDFRHLSLTHREKLLRWGLRDRDESVRKATARLFRERWVEDCARTNAAAAAAAESTEGDEQGDGGAVQQPAIAKPDYDALLELLERIDIVNSGIEGGVAIEAMQHFWEGRPDYCDFITFEGAFWDVLTPESAFVARTFNAFCRGSDSAKYQAMADDKMPEVTRFAFILQKQIGRLVELVQACAAEEKMELEEDMVQHEFAVEQLLHIALRLDYTDEIGRRKMFSVMREALALAELPEECTKLVVEILRIVCGNAGPGEREFCSIVLEAIAEVHDTIMGEDGENGANDNGSAQGDESFHSAQSEISSGDGDTTPTRSNKNQLSRSDADRTQTTADGKENDEEKAIKEIMVNMKCLHIAQCMLQNVQCQLEQNSSLAIMVDNLVIPAVRSQEAPIRERGLVCLGLCCLLSKTLANENLNLFLHCFSKGHEALQIIALEIVSDILLTHPSLLAPSPPAPPAEAQTPAPTDASEMTNGNTTANTLANNTTNLTNATNTTNLTHATNATNTTTVNPYEKPVLKMFSRALKSGDSAVQSTGATALCKLMLAQVIREPDLLRQLVLAYFDPDMSGNAALRQALAYFLPVYCHSRGTNAARMLTVVVPVLHMLAGAMEEADGQVDEDMVGLNVVAGHFAEWTDGRRIVGYSEEGKDGYGVSVKVEYEEDKKAPSGVCAEVVEAVVAVAAEALAKIASGGVSKPEKKALTSLLTKLYFPPTIPQEDLATFLEHLADTIDSRGVPDATARNALTRLHQSLSKYLPAAGDVKDDGDDGGTVLAAVIASASTLTVVDARGDDDGSRRPSADSAVSGNASGSVGGGNTSGGGKSVEQERKASGGDIGMGDVDDTKDLTTVNEDTQMMEPDAEGTIIGDETSVS